MIHSADTFIDKARLDVQNIATDSGWDRNEKNVSKISETFGTVVLMSVADCHQIPKYGILGDTFGTKGLSLSKKL